MRSYGDIIFSWTARKPSTASSRYQFMITWTNGSHRRNPPQGCPGGSGGSVLGRVGEGERLTIGDFVPAACTGTYTSTVYYDPNTDPGGNAGGVALLRPQQDGYVVVGHFKAAVS